MRKRNHDWALGIAWKRTTVFCKLCKHKVLNGTLPGEFQDYSLPIFGIWKYEESEIMKAKGEVKHGGDRTNENDIYAFDRIAYDEKIRATIDNIKNNLSRVQ